MRHGPRAASEIARVLGVDADALYRLLRAKSMLGLLVNTNGGRERTLEEYRLLLASAGLELERVVPTAGPLSIIEARVKACLDTGRPGMRGALLASDVCTRPLRRRS